MRINKHFKFALLSRLITVEHVFCYTSEWRLKKMRIQAASPSGVVQRRGFRSSHAGTGLPPKPPWPGLAALPASAFHWLGISFAQSLAGFLGVPQDFVPPSQPVTHRETHTHWAAGEPLCESTLLPTLS